MSLLKPPALDLYVPDSSLYETQIVPLVYLEFKYYPLKLLRLLYISQLFRRQDGQPLSMQPRDVLPQHSLKSIALLRTNDQDIFRQRPHFGACLRACDWIEQKDRDNGMPFYLWDTSSNKQGEVKNIICETGQCHRQSHLGKMEEIGPAMGFIGFRPLKISPNSKFHVGNLAKYSWM